MAYAEVESISRARNRTSLLMRAGPVAALIWCALPSASAANGETYTKTMVTGSKLKLAGFYSLNPDCTSRGFSVVRVLSAPTHGVLAIGKGVTYPRYDSSIPQSSCNVRQVPSTNVVYVPERGFLGTDYLTVEAIFPSGADWTESFIINVK